MRGTGADQPVVATKPGNAGGAKGLNGSAKGWINQRWEEFMPEARSCVKAYAGGRSQPAMGGTDA